MTLLKTLALAATPLIAATSASAATLTLNATILNPINGSNFSIVFDDLDGDGLLSANEILSFSGFSKTLPGTGLVTYDEVLRVSPTPPQTDEPLTFTSGGFAITSWLFGVSGSTDRTTAPQHLFSYAIAPVPVPASALLLLGALGGLGLARRRKAQG